MKKFVLAVAIVTVTSSIYAYMARPCLGTHAVQTQTLLIEKDTPALDRHHCSEQTLALQKAVVHLQIAPLKKSRSSFFKATLIDRPALVDSKQVVVGERAPPPSPLFKTPVFLRNASLLI